MTRSMTRWALAGCMALAAMGAVAVLDVGARTADAAPSVSQFVGSWSGPWIVAEGTEGEHGGTFDWTISDQGHITGRVHPLTGTSGDVVGHVGADGDIRIVGFAPNDEASSGANGYPFRGTAEIDADGRLVVSMTGAEGSGGNPLVAVLERN